MRMVDIKQQEMNAKRDYHKSQKDYQKKAIETKDDKEEDGDEENPSKKKKKKRKNKKKKVLDANGNPIEP